MPHNKIIANLLLTNLPDFRLEHLRSSPERIHARLTSTRNQTACPKCATLTSSVHSRYTRTVADLPWAGLPVTLELGVRRFRCRHPACEQNAFCERFPSNLEPHARKTNRLGAVLQNLGANVGGQLGARLAKHFTLASSASTILRHVMVAPLPDRPAPTVIGVDDFAFKRGHTYGTIIVDLERLKPIDLLSDRKAATLESWLKAHPSVEVISRDRSGEYAKGIGLGAPNAVQVLDRWHLLRNLREALERVLNRHRGQIKKALKTKESYGPPPRTKAELERKEAHQRTREDLHAKIKELTASGLSQRTIARRLGVSRERVIRYARSDAPPERTRPRKPSILDAFEPFLRQRWMEGCHSGLQLLREIRERGFPGSRKRVALWAQGCRERERDGLPPFDADDADPTKVPMTNRQLVWLLLDEPAALSDEEFERVRLVEATCPLIAVARMLALDFGRVVRTRSTNQLEAWFSKACSSEVADIRSFATGLEREKPALVKALELPWSNGPVEGRVNKLKLLKRQGYGRSGFELLRKRVLLVA